MIENHFIDNSICIFSDASMHHTKDEVTDMKFSCYGSIMVSDGAIIDQLVFPGWSVSNIDAEIKGLRSAIILALKYQNIKPIKIFSDSQTALFGLRDRFNTWNLRDGVLLGYGAIPIKYQWFFVEMVNMINENNLKVELYYTPGHITKTPSSKLEAKHKFQSANYIREDISPYVINCLADYNNHIDELTRKTLYDYYDNRYEFPATQAIYKFLPKKGVKL